MHEHIVHALDDAVTFDPNVLAVAIRPVAVDPDAVGTTPERLLDCHLTWGWRLDVRRSDRLGFLHDDHRLAVDLLGDAVLDFDHDVIRSLGSGIDLTAGRLITARIPVMRHVDLVRRRGVVPRRALVIGSSRNGQSHRRRPCGEGNQSSEGSHVSSNPITPVARPRHPERGERAPPARQEAEKVLGLRPFE
jgi:hypothetical protein